MQGRSRARAAAMAAPAFRHLASRPKQRTRCARCPMAPLRARACSSRAKIFPRALPCGLTALTSGFEALDAWVKQTLSRAGLPIATHLPLMANSDHANFAAQGIPALRLIAGFNQPRSNLRFLLTAADTRDKVAADDLH